MIQNDKMCEYLHNFACAECNMRQITVSYSGEEKRCSPAQVIRTPSPRKRRFARKFLKLVKVSAGMVRIVEARIIPRMA